jgi:hypothetical protein
MSDDMLNRLWDAAARIEDLEAQLAEMEAERDKWGFEAFVRQGKIHAAETALATARADGYAEGIREVHERIWGKLGGTQEAERVCGIIEALLDTPSQPTPAPLPDRGKMVKPKAGAPAGGYPSGPRQAVAERPTPAPEAVVKAALPDVDELAQIIRAVDGDNTLGAGALAEAIIAKAQEGGE